MTRELLEDYPHICARISAYEKKQQQTVVSDTVSGSLPDYPYTEHTVSIRGVIRLTPQEELDLKRLRQKKMEIEAWFNSLPSEKERQIIELHIFKGLGWKKVFRYTHHNSPDSARMFYKNTLKKFL